VIKDRLPDKQGAVSACFPGRSVSAGGIDELVGLWDIKLLPVLCTKKIKTVYIISETALVAYGRDTGVTSADLS
jgi:hypothetical protein